MNVIVCLEQSRMMCHTLLIISSLLFMAFMVRMGQTACLHSQFNLLLATERLR